MYVTTYALYRIARFFPKFSSSKLSRLAKKPSSCDTGRIVLTLPLPTHTNTKSSVCRRFCRRWKPWNRTWWLKLTFSLQQRYFFRPSCDVMFPLATFAPLFTIFMSRVFFQCVGWGSKWKSELPLMVMGFRVTLINGLELVVGDCHRMTWGLLVFLFFFFCCMQNWIWDNQVHEIQLVSFASLKVIQLCLFGWRLN